MILKEWHCDSGIEEIDLSKAQFCVQLHGMPLAIASPGNIVLIGRHMDTLLEIEPLSDGVACKKIVLLKVELDVSKPLKTGFPFLRHSGTLAKIIFNYEKLSDFCYHYGRIDHTINSCGDLEFLIDVKYGSDLRVDL